MLDTAPDVARKQIELLAAASSGRGLISALRATTLGVGSHLKEAMAEAAGAG